MCVAIVVNAVLTVHWFDLVTGQCYLIDTQVTGGQLGRKTAAGASNCHND